jgi:Tol biopolymer transport system component
VIALASSGCGGGGGAEDCRPAKATIAFDNHPGGHYDRNELHLINGDGSGRRLLAQHGFSPAWSPDGCGIAFIRWPRSGSNELYVVNADGTDLRPLTRTPRIDETLPVWAPDGSRIAVTLAGEEDGTLTSHIDVLNSDGSGRRRLVPFQASDPSWSPNGRRIAFSRWFTVSTYDLYIVDADGRNLRRLTRRSGTSLGANFLAWSPDGRRIAFVGGGPNSFVWDVYVIDADGTRLRRVTTSPRHEGSRGDYPLVWSPDGQRIAFVRRSDARGTDLYVVRADGSRLRRLTRSGDVDEPAWSRDGLQIAFTRRSPAGDYDQADLYVVNVDGSGVRRMTKTPDLEAEPVWSPQ